MTVERKFFRDILIGFLAVVLLVAGVNAVVDPFRMNDLSRMRFARDELAPLYNSRLYKLVGYDRARARRVVIGDSRCDKLKSEYFAAAGEPGMYNLSFGGASLYEVLDAFWFAAKRAPLELVVLCIPFNLYDESNRTNGVPDAVNFIEHPASYYLSPFVLRVSGVLIWQRLTGGYLRTQDPRMTREAFWRHQLGPEVAGAYRFWREPTVLRAKLEAVAAHCRDRGIHLVLFIPPNHVDLQRRVDDFGLREAYQRYKQDLGALGTLVDFDRDTEFTRSRDNYADPYHPTDAGAAEVARDLVHALARGGRGGDERRHDASSRNESAPELAGG